MTAPRGASVAGVLCAVTLLARTVLAWQGAPAEAPPQEPPAPASVTAPSAEAPGAAPPGAASASVAAADAPTPGRAQILRRLVVIGASASYGIGLRATLADALDAMIAAPHEVPLDGALGGFAATSAATRAELTRLAAAHEPSALIAVDFLFWYAHGFRLDSHRLAYVEEGLAALDGFDCPVVIAKIPDLAPLGDLRLSPPGVPSRETLSAINRRIGEWAERRPNVVVLPLVQLVDDMRHGRELRVGSWTWPAGEEGRFLQPDGVHPTEEGLLVLACLVAEGLRGRFPMLQPGDFLADRDAIRAGMLASAAARTPSRIPPARDGGTAPR